MLVLERPAAAGGEVEAERGGGGMGGRAAYRCARWALAGRNRVTKHLAPHTHTETQPCCHARAAMAPPRAPGARTGGRGLPGRRQRLVHLNRPN
jgi:hypothetical protein